MIAAVLVSPWSFSPLGYRCALNLIAELPQAVSWAVPAGWFMGMLDTHGRTPTVLLSTCPYEKPKIPTLLASFSVKSHSEPIRTPSVARYNQCMQIKTTATLKRKRKTVKSRPYAGTRLAKFVETRVLELRPRKSQIEIATEAGYVNPNMLAMIKNGSTKLPLDRVPSVAKALECDARLLFKLALEQPGGATTAVAIEAIFGTIVTRNEVAALPCVLCSANEWLWCRRRIRGWFQGPV
jgi:hypothetical protein